jgi:hypothetical protein
MRTTPGNLGKNTCPTLKGDAVNEISTGKNRYSSEKASVAA